MSIYTLICVIFFSISIVLAYILFEYIKLKNEIKAKSDNANTDFKTEKIKEIQLIAEVKKVHDTSHRGELFKKAYERKFLNEANSNIETEIKDNIQEIVSLEDLKKNNEIVKSYSKTDIDYLKAMFFISKKKFHENI